MKFTGSKGQAKELLLTVDDFSGASNSLVEEARMNLKFAKESVNMMQVQDGLWKTRWGTAYYGQDLVANPDGVAEYVKSDGSTELIAVSNGVVYKSTDGGSWSQVTGATFTAGTQCYFTQIAGWDNTTSAYKSYLYIVNGTDSMARYDGTSLTTYTEIAAPANLSASLVASGLTSGTYTYYAEVTALNSIGETVGSTEASIAVNKERDNWTSTTDKVHWSWDAVAGATRYQLYLSDQSTYENLLTDTDQTNFVDDGTIVINTYVVVPDANTTGAPKFKSMTISNNRIWATSDPNNLYTVYWSGTGKEMGNFADFYGGGWIALERGGREMPIAVKHYQTGAGEGRLTTLCKTPEGHGAVWQIQIGTATVGDTTFSIPTATKVVGSWGTEALLGVVATSNDIMFPNRKGWFSLGPEKNFYGILRTRELSSNIRPYWRSLIGSKIDKICAYFYDSKVFISVPTSTSGNDRMIIYDTERGNWACDWSIGAKQYLEYTDTNGVTHFLYIPLSGTKLIELSENVLNDLGTAFYQSYVSPLIPVSKRKTDIMKHKESILELIRPRGSVTFQILGVGKDNTFNSFYEFINE